MKTSCSFNQLCFHFFHAFELARSSHPGAKLVKEANPCDLDRLAIVFFPILLHDRFPDELAQSFSSGANNVL